MAMTRPSNLHLAPIESFWSVEKSAAQQCEYPLEPPSEPPVSGKVGWAGYARYRVTVSEEFEVPDEALHSDGGAN